MLFTQSFNIIRVSKKKKWGESLKSSKSFVCKVWLSRRFGVILDLDGSKAAAVADISADMLKLTVDTLIITHIMSSLLQKSFFPRRPKVYRD